jgi:hypothetical protein
MEELALLLLVATLDRREAREHEVDVLFRRH